MQLFQINYKKFVLLLLPIFLRKSTTVAFLNALCSPIQMLYNTFLSNRDSNIYRAKMNGQVCYLRRVLNDGFPDANGEIRIDDGDKRGDWVFAWSEDYDTYLYYLELTNDSPLIWDQVVILEGLSNFTVYVPTRLRSENNENKLKSLLNRYKLISKKYNVIYE